MLMASAAYTSHQAFKFPKGGLASASADCKAGAEKNISPASAPPPSVAADPHGQHAFVNMCIQGELLNLFGDILAFPERVVSKGERGAKNPEPASGYYDTDEQEQNERHNDSKREASQEQVPLVALVDAHVLFARESQLRLGAKPPAGRESGHKGAAKAAAADDNAPNAHPTQKLLRPVRAAHAHARARPH
jgi:hypothetical protein